MAYLITLCSGLFFLIGIFTYNIIKNKKVFERISLSCAFIVIIGLIVLDLIPDLIEDFKWYLIIFILIGLFILIIIDKLIPHHHHKHKDNDELSKSHQENIEHISNITMIALLLHNLLENITLYNVSVDNIESGLLMLLGIGLHNIPFGFQIASSKYKNKILITILVLSGLIASIIYSIFGILDNTLSSILLALTIGMLIHISIFELFKVVWQNKDKKETLYGIIIGIVVLILISII